MPRPPSVSDEKFRKEYRRASTIDELAKSLGLTKMTVYKYLNRLELDPYDTSRDDLRSFTDEEIYAAHKVSSSIVEMATRLNCTQQTVRRHMDRLKLPRFDHTLYTDEFAVEMFNAYQGIVRVSDISISHDIPKSAIRSLFDRAMRIIWDQDGTPPDLPIPDLHCQIKVFHALKKSPHLTTGQVMTITRVPVDHAQAYMKKVKRHGRTKRRKERARAKDRG
jgi:hypothetical protein